LEELVDRLELSRVNERDLHEPEARLGHRLSVCKLQSDLSTSLTSSHSSLQSSSSTVSVISKIRSFKRLPSFEGIVRRMRIRARWIGMVLAS
jgi:hypothetical protein